ncbi:MAG TPA: mechanosensitive ion channel domain-containing protein [Candidatus Limnocylindria bacterium]|jgi:small conductance mechanosensitive channel|nr:mechanosensitive ion channel domain-containing protein [Candidatus Limnocylindria bacterium]
MFGIDLDLPSTIALRVLLIVVGAAAALIAARVALAAAARGVLGRRSSTASALMAPGELQRRVHTLQRLAIRVIGSVIVIVAVLMILDQFAVDIGPAIAGLGVVGIAVGLGAQTLVKDWLAGIFIVLENQFSAGERVRIAGVEGIVEDFSLRRTTLRDADGTVHTVPNGQIIVASNLSRGRGGMRTGFSPTGDAAEPPQAPQGQ